jgi:hypothetical protein
MSQVVTELVIDADTSGADRFSEAMEKAANSTHGVSSSISGTMLAIAGIGGGMLAAIAGIRGVVDQVVNANKELADMQSTAERVGLSLKDLQAVKLGGAITGLSDSDLNAGLEKSSQLLNDAQRKPQAVSRRDGDPRFRPDPCRCRKPLESAAGVEGFADLFARDMARVRRRAFGLDPVA